MTAPRALVVLAVRAAAAAPATSLTVNLATPGHDVRAVHGVSQGPVVEAAWLDHMPRSISEDQDFASNFAAADVPAVRVHGMGCVDMDQLWAPTPRGTRLVQFRA